MSVNQQLAFEAEEIRDTDAHNSDVVFNGDFTIKTLIIENGLNQTVTFQCQGSAHEDFSNPFNIGTTWDVSASTNIYQSCSTYIPYWRVVAQCGSSPSTGSLTVIVLGVKGA